MSFKSPQSLKQAIIDLGYIIEDDFATTIYLAYHLEKPILISGPPGCGKTEIAYVMSSLMNSEVIRLQAYEGIDDAKSIYEWNYKKQLLYIEANKDNLDWNYMHKDIYSEEFLSPRPILKSITQDKKSILLIDEIDKSDEEFEPLLLEVLSSFQVSIPEIGTIKAKNKPFVILTSNDMRELSDALKRRCCFYYIEYPSIEKELAIIHSRAPGVDNLLATQVVNFVNSIRKENLRKTPSISETIDWVNALVKMNTSTLNPEIVKSTLNILLKTKSDLDFVNNKVDSMISKLPKKAMKLEKSKNDKKIEEQINKLINDENKWDF